MKEFIVETTDSINNGINIEFFSVLETEAKAKFEEMIEALKQNHKCHEIIAQSTNEFIIRDSVTYEYYTVCLNIIDIKIYE